MVTPKVVFGRGVGKEAETRVGVSTAYSRGEKGRVRFMDAPAGLPDLPELAARVTPGRLPAINSHGGSAAAR
jgi:hypothetical protein